MTIEEFNDKHKHLFDMGACMHFDYPLGGKGLLIDRYVDGKFVCERNEIDRAQADARKMGYQWAFTGCYVKRI